MGEETREREDARKNLGSEALWARQAASWPDYNIHVLCSVTEKGSDGIGILWDITGMALRGRVCAQDGICDDVMGMSLAVFWLMEMERSLPGISKNNLPTSPQLLGATNCPKGSRLVPNAEKPQPPIPVFHVLTRTAHPGSSS